MAFTPDQRVSVADPVTRVKGHVTSGISLADEAEYDLGGTNTALRKRADNVGRYRVTVEDAGVDAERERVFKVRSVTQVVPTAWAVSTNVVTLTLPSGHGIEDNQWISVAGFATAPAVTLGDFQVTSTTATTALYSATTSNANATEDGTVDFNRVTMEAGVGEVIYDQITGNDVAIALGTLRAGRYVVFAPGQAPNAANFYSDGTTVDLDDLTDGIAEYDDANTDARTDLWVNSGVLTLSNRDAVATRIRVEFYPDDFSGLDVNGDNCFYEKAKSLRIKNRSGGTLSYAIERL